MTTEKKRRINISGPWGEFNIIPDDYKALVEASLAQLEYFYTVQCNTSAHIKADIEGYKNVLQSSDVDVNAKRFIIEKRSAINKNKRYADNLAVIDALKKKGQWL